MVALAALGLLASAPARAAEITAFISGASPDPLWGTGFGGSLGLTLLNVVGLEGEGAWQGGQTAASDMWSLSGRAYIGPSIGRFVPFAGIATGVYRQSLRGVSDTGVNSGFFVGLKFKFPLGVVVKGEYQWVHMPEDALIQLDNRYYFGAGLTF
jgi:hypothetical protein